MPLLSPKERRIVEAYYMLDSSDGADDVTLGEIGRKVDCSGEYVRRILKEAVSMG